MVKLALWKKWTNMWSRYILTETSKELIEEYTFKLSAYIKYWENFNNL